MDRFWETELPIYSIFPYPAIERYTPTTIPIPSNSGRAMSRAERLKWNLYRVVNKTEKIWSNRKLAAVDNRMRAQMPAFDQVYEMRR